MCGIAGTYGHKDKDLAKSLIVSIAHRGPDQEPIVIKRNNCALAACRLSIENIRNGSQPFLIENRVMGCFNGEIYNYKYLIKELKAKGHHFENGSEIEAICLAYIEYGIDFIQNLEGMFSIAIYDLKKDALFLIRDSMGIKPLYYCINGSTIAFSSEIKSFINTKQSSLEINLTYMAYRHVFDFVPSNINLFENISTVIPGTYLIFKNGKLLSHNYKFASANDEPSDLNTINSTIKNILHDTVNTQIPNSVNWALLLSGGVDSSILALLAKEKLVRSNGKLITISDKTITEDLTASRKVANFLNLKLHEVKITTSDLLKDISDYVFTIEEFETQSFFWYLLFRSLKGKLKVVLCGQGADELFAGYSFYYDKNYLISCQEKLANIKNYVRENLYIQIQQTIVHLKSTRLFYKFFLEEQLPWFQLSILDKCSMCHGIEARVPYLSQELVSRISKLPIKQVVNNKTIEKKLLRDSFSFSNLPNLYRPKRFSGRGTLPTIYKKVEKLSQIEISDKYFKNHEYSQFLNSKTELLFLESFLERLKK